MSQFLFGAIAGSGITILLLVCLAVIGRANNLDDN